MKMRYYLFMLLTVPVVLSLERCTYNNKPPIEEKVIGYVEDSYKVYAEDIADEHPIIEKTEEVFDQTFTDKIQESFKEDPQADSKENLPKEDSVNGSGSTQEEPVIQEVAPTPTWEQPNNTLLVNGQVAPLVLSSYENLQGSIDNNPYAWTSLDRLKAVNDGVSVALFRHDYTGGNAILQANSITLKDYNGNVKTYYYSHTEDMPMGRAFSDYQNRILDGLEGETIMVQTCISQYTARLVFFKG